MKLIWGFFIAVILVVASSSAEVRDIELEPGKRLSLNFGYDPEVRHDDSGAVGITYAPSTKTLTFHGIKFGEARIQCLKNGSVEDSFRVRVLPINYNIYRRMLLQHPRLRLDVGDGKVLISGPVSSAQEVDTVQKLMALDAPYKQLSDNTFFDGSPLLENARKFLAERKFHNLDLRLMNKTVFISGEVYDPKRREQLIQLTKDYFSSLGCEINTAGIEISARKILIRVMFLDVDKSLANNFGIKVNSPIDWSLGFQKIMPYLSVGGNNNGVTITNLSGVIEVLQANSVLKVVYENRLSTVSGEKAEFQSGGVLNVRIRGYESGSLKEIEYGFRIITTPYTIDDNTIGLDFEMLDNRPKNENTWTSGDNDKDLTKYLTKSRYTIPAGNGLVVSSFTKQSVGDSREGLPYLCDIPWVGSWLFGKSGATATDHEIVLILQVDWADRDLQLSAEELAQIEKNIRKLQQESRERSSLKDSGKL